MDDKKNARKYGSKPYKRDNVIHETSYYQVYEEGLIINSSVDRNFIYNFLSFKKKENPTKKYKLYKVIHQRIKHAPNEEL